VFVCTVVILLVAPATADAKRRRRTPSLTRSYPIEIRTTPKRATITLDTGEVIGRTPLKTELRAGTHILSIEKPGYARFEYAAEPRSTSTASVSARRRGESI
jgi:hypothetical protein